MPAKQHLGGRENRDDRLVDQWAIAGSRPGPAKRNRARRENGADLCLAIADIDRFKPVNDKFGHVVGDHLLASFAETLAKRARAGRSRALRRRGIRAAVPRAGLERAAASRIRRELENKRWVVGAKEERLGAVTASFGLARLGPARAPRASSRRADENVGPKSAGRNRVVVEHGATRPSPRRGAGST